MGLFDSIPGYSGSPFGQWAASNPYAVRDIGSSFASGFGGMVGAGNDPRMALEGFSKGLTTARNGQAEQQNALIQQQQEMAQKQAAVQAEQDKQNQTIAWLKAKYPQYAQLPAAEGFQLAMNAEKQAQDKANGGGENFFGNGVPIQNPDGTISYGQFGNQGSFNVPKLPEGSRFLTPVEQLNTGTGFTGVDRFGNTTGSVTPIDNVGASRDKAFGEGVGKAAIDRINALPGVVAKADNMLGTIDGVLNDPALDSSTGWLAWLQGVPGTDQYRFGQRALQLQGQAFLQAFESLKGAGQITEVEGSKATQAIGRLSTAQKAEDYRDALNELKSLVSAAKTRAQSQAGVPPALGGPQAGGATGGYTVLSVE